MYQGLETQAGGRVKVFGPFPHTQQEMPKGLGWRDDGTYPQMGPQLSSGLSHGAMAISM